MNDDIQKVLYIAKIQDTCVELGKQLTKDYQVRPLVVCVLKGAVPLWQMSLNNEHLYGS